MRNVLESGRWPLLIAFLFIWTLSTRGIPTVSGDQPHYLMVAESLLTDHDLDLTNNYAQNQGRLFGADGVTGEVHARPNRFGARWSVHDIGLPASFLPLYAAATRLATLMPTSVLTRMHQTTGRFAFALISLGMIGMSVWAMSLLLSAMKRTDPRWAPIVMLALAISPPVLSHAFLFFPETPAFAVSCAVMWLIALRSGDLTLGRVTTVAAAVGFLPWLHRKYSFFVFGLAFLILWTHRAWLGRQARWLLLVLTLLIIVPQLLLHAWTLYAWGSLGGPQMLDGVPFSLAGVPLGALGMIFDRERGLLGYAPIYALVPVCWALTWRRNWPLIVPVIALFMPLAAFQTWNAGFSPAARFLVPIAPLLVWPVAEALRHQIVRTIAAPLVIVQSAIAFLAWSHPRDLWPREEATNRILDKIPVIGPAYDHWLPSLSTGDPLAQGTVCLACLIAGTALVVFAVRSASRPEAG